MKLVKIKKEFEKLKEGIEELLSLDEEIKILKANSVKEELNFFDVTKSITKEKERKIELLKLKTSNRFENNMFKINESFLDEIFHTKNLEVNKNIGVIISEIKTRTEIIPDETKLSQDRKKLTMEFDSFNTINNLKFEFYKENGESQNLNEILVYANTSEGEVLLKESFERYYDDNYSLDDFKKEIIINPKNINKITFELPKEINLSKSYVQVFQNEYKTEEESTAIIKIKNKYNNQGLFKINKKDYTEYVNCDYSYSYDNINYKNIDFSKTVKRRIIDEDENYKTINVAYNSNESTIDDYNGSIEDFYIKIKSNNNSFINHSVKESSVSKNINSDKVREETSVYQLDENIDFDSLKIQLTYSNASLLDPELKLGITEKSNMYFIKQNLIKKVPLVSKEEKEELKKIDDIEFIYNEESKFEILFEESTNKIYFPGYIDKIDFEFEYNYVESFNSIERKYYTPIIFDISLLFN